MNAAATLPILHADDALAVVNKAAGLLAVPGRGPAGLDNAWDRLRRELPDALVVHRLDMSTSGLLLFARGAEAQRRLSRSFAEGAVAKRYLAVVFGQPQAASGRIDLALAADWPRRPRQMVDPEHGKASTTLWHRVEGVAPPGCSRLELEPLTGRTHQLRVHLAAIGHPIAGDALYAEGAALAAAPRLLLHAWRLALRHPFSGAELEFECAPDF